MLRPQTEHTYAFILDCELHHPGMAKLDQTLPLLHAAKAPEKELELNAVYLWQRQESGFYQRAHDKVMGSKSSILEYLDDETGFKVIIDRGNPDLISDRHRVSICIPDIQQNQLPLAESTLIRALFYLGLGSIAFPQRPVDRERILSFAANRIKHSQEHLAYDQERDLSLYTQPVETLKEVLGVTKGERARVYEVENVPGHVTSAQIGLESQIKQSGASFLYHDIFMDIGIIGQVEFFQRLGVLFKDGLCSTAHRFRHGQFITGESSKCDVEQGGGCSVFTRLQKGDQPFIPMSRFSIILDTRILKFINNYMYDRDNYGTKKGDDYKRRSAPNALLLTPYFQSRLSEFMVKHHIPSHHMVCLVMDQSLYQKYKKEIDQTIMASGILGQNNISLEDFIVFRSETTKQSIERVLAQHQPTISQVPLTYHHHIQSNHQLRKLKR